MRQCMDYYFYFNYDLLLSLSPSILIRHRVYNNRDDLALHAVLINKYVNYVLT